MATPLLMYAAPGISHVIFTFCTTEIVQNVKITWEMPDIDGYRPSRMCHAMSLLAATASMSPTVSDHYFSQVKLSNTRDSQLAISVFFPHDKCHGQSGINIAISCSEHAKNSQWLFQILHGISWVLYHLSSYVDVHCISILASLEWNLLVWLMLHLLGIVYQKCLRNMHICGNFSHSTCTQPLLCFEWLQSPKRMK